MSEPTDFLALDEGALLAAAAELAQPAYRVRQLLRWVYARGVGSFAEMSNLPVHLRTELESRYRFSRPYLVSRQVSQDGTRKYLWRMRDGVHVESVGIPERERLTVCFSTQAGCAMGCAFCATGQGGLVRDLGAGEIALQVTLVAADFEQRASNAVAMGQGEPFANYDATLGALRILNSPDALGIGARHLTVSTCGLARGIERFAGEPEQFTLAVSLHSAVQTTRDRLMPAMASFPLPRLRTALASYATATGRRPTLEYALVRGVNDREEELQALVAFCSGSLVHVNLIPVNPVAGTGLARSTAEIVERFRARLESAGIDVSVRSERGSDIDAACGQLRQRVLGGPDTGQVTR